MVVQVEEGYGDASAHQHGCEEQDATQHGVANLTGC